MIPENLSWALLGDAHLREGDPEVDAFVDFLDALPESIGVLAVLGDLFAAWIGRPDLERPHHRRVLDALARLGQRGCRLIYVEGNHDFFLRDRFEGKVFETVAETSLETRAAGRPTHLAHGDLVNRHDRQYRAWRAISKSRPFFAAFNLIPRVPRLRIVDRLEAKMAETNMAFRGGFPVAEAIAYARPRLRAGTEVLVFGHFHEERRIEVEEAGRRGAIYVLPAWRAGHRYLRLSAGAAPEFVSA